MGMCPRKLTEAASTKRKKNADLKYIWHSHACVRVRVRSLREFFSLFRTIKKGRHSSSSILFQWQLLKMACVKHTGIYRRRMIEGHTATHYPFSMLFTFHNISLKRMWVCVFLPSISHTKRIICKLHTHGGSAGGLCVEMVGIKLITSLLSLLLVPSHRAP